MRASRVDIHTSGLYSLHMSTSPIRVYLDQNHVIALSGARQGRPKHPTHAIAYDFLRQAVRRGEVICPVSSVHVMESNKAHRADQRSGLADILLELSGGGVLWPCHLAISAEAEYAVRRYCKLSAQSPWHRAIGVGTEHLLGMPLRARQADGSEVPVPTRVVEASRSLEALRFAIETRRGSDPTGSELQAVRDMETVRATARQARATRHDLDEHNTRWIYQEMWVPALERAISSLAGVPAKRDDMALPGDLTFFRSIPLVDAMVTITAWRDAEWHRDLQPNDIRDARWADVAFAYCDAVVCEGHTAALARQSGLTGRLGVTVHDTLANLSEVVERAQESRLARTARNGT